MKLLLLLTGNKESEKTTRKYWHGRAWKDRVEFTRWICEGWVKISSLGLTMGHSKCYRFWKHTKRNRNNCSKADLGFIWFIYKHSYLKISFPSDFVKMSPLRPLQYQSRYWVDVDKTGWCTDSSTYFFKLTCCLPIWKREREDGEREREGGRIEKEGRGGSKG